MRKRKGNPIKGTAAEGKCPRLLLCQNHPCADIALAVRVLCVAAHRIEASPPALFTEKDFASCKTPGALPLDPAACPKAGENFCVLAQVLYST